MATKGLGIEQECFCCSICLDLLKVPVTIPCGHSYCMNCVNTHWDGEVGKQSYSCPQCRQNFTQRPVLVKNTMLALLMEGFNKSGAPAAPESDCSAANGDVSCDLCSGSKVKAVKSCLQCLVSYCKEHLQPHYDVAALKKHKLTEPTANLQDNICSRHDEVMKMFCRTDQQCICFLCSVDEHKDHDTVTAAAARTEKDRELETFKDTILLILDQKKKNMSKLQGEVKEMLSSADSAMDCSDRGLKDLIGLVEQSVNDLKKQIRDEQEADTRRAVELQDKLRREITELERKRTELDSLSRTQDHLQFLHKFASVSKACDASASSYFCKIPPFRDMVTAVENELRHKLQEERQSELPTLVVQEERQSELPTLVEHVVKRQARGHVVGVQVNAPPAPAPPTDPNPNAPTFLRGESPDLDALSPSRCFLDYSSVTLAELVRFSRRLTFDPCTLNHNLKLSAGETVVRRMAQSQGYRPHPSRFLYSSQVVTRGQMTGRCFWQVEGRYENGFAVAVSVSDPVRRNVWAFGHDGGSWALECYNDEFLLWHEAASRCVPYDPSLRGTTRIRIGVLLDYGILSFYRISSDESVHLIHAVSTKSDFQPMVAGVCLEDINSTATLL